MFFYETFLQANLSSVILQASLFSPNMLPSGTTCIAPDVSQVIPFKEEP